MKINAAAVILLTALSAVAGGCNPAPDGVLSPDEMAEVLADIHIGESVSETERRVFNNDSIRRVLKQSILMKHGLNSETFDSSLMWYGQHIDLYTKVYEHVTEILEDRITRLESEGVYNAQENSRETNLASIEFDGDSVDVWTMARSYMLTDRGPVTQIPFHLTNDNNWEKGDRYIMNLTTHGLKGQLGVTMAVEYFDGSVDYFNSLIAGNGKRNIKLALDSAKNAHYVYGVISSQPVKDSRLFIDSLSLYRVRKAPHNAGERFIVKHLEHSRP